MRNGERRQSYAEREYAFVKRLADSPGGNWLRRLTPQAARRSARAVLAAPTMAGLAHDPRSFARLLRMNANQAGSDGDAEPLGVRLSPLSGTTALLRPGTSDVAVARDLFVSTPHILPDGLLDSPPRQIWDLGAHIGLAAMHYAVLYPGASITAVEAESTNASLCRRNLAAVDARCEVVEAAVWDEDGSVELDLGTTEPAASVTNAFRVSEDSAATPSPDGGSVDAISLNSLLERGDQGTRIDYCKMDIEGAEERVLRNNNGWAEHVRTILVEVHPPYAREECEVDLERLGFRVVSGAGQRPDAVIGVRS